MEDCAVCLDRHSPSKSTTIASSTVCHNCVRHIFEQAINSEENYPPKWGIKVLNVHNFYDILPRDLPQRLLEKEREYQTPPAERVYCKNVDPDAMVDIGEEVICEKFVGRIVKDWAKNVAASICPRVKCKACATSYCLNCGDPYVPLHQCKQPGPATDDDKAFEGLVKGKDYQVCPFDNCRRKIELRDGCNAVACRCGKTFCFVCGAGDVRGDHWGESRGVDKCPRFGHPSNANALYDRLVEPDFFFFREQFEDTELARFARRVRRGAVAGLAEPDGVQGAMARLDRRAARQADRLNRLEQEIGELEDEEADVNHDFEQALNATIGGARPGLEPPNLRRFGRIGGQPPGMFNPMRAPPALPMEPASVRQAREVGIRRAMPLEEAVVHAARFDWPHGITATAERSQQPTIRHAIRAVRNNDLRRAAVDLQDRIDSRFPQQPQDTTPRDQRPQHRRQRAPQEVDSMAPRTREPSPPLSALPRGPAHRDPNQATRWSNFPAFNNTPQVPLWHMPDEHGPRLSPHQQQAPNDRHRRQLPLEFDQRTGATDAEPRANFATPERRIRGSNEPSEVVFQGRASGQTRGRPPPPGMWEMP